MLWLAVHFPRCQRFWLEFSLQPSLFYSSQLRCLQRFTICLVYHKTLAVKIMGLDCIGNAAVSQE